MLTPLESFWLRWHSEHSPEPFAKSARVVLSADSGATPAAIAEASGSTEAEVALVLEDYAARRLATFPRPALTLEDLLQAAAVDRAHAQLVAELAAGLFNATRSLHRLPPTLRRLLEASAWLHDVGLHLDEAHHQLAGRNLLRSMELLGYTRIQQAMIACAVSFHRKKIRPHQDDLFTALTTARRRQTLGMTALLRLADGLAARGVSHLERVIITPKAVTLHLTNPEAASKAARHEVAHMLRKTDVWETVFHLPIQAVVRTPPPDIAGLAELPLDLRGPTHQVARRALASALLRWQASLAPALAGDEAAQEDILTAAASLRAVLKLFAGCFDQRAAQKLQKPLKEIERTVKQARRARAGLAAAEGELAELGKETGTTSLLAAWKKQRAAAKAQVQACLGGAGASDLLAALAALLAAEPAGEAAPVHRRLGQIVDALAAEMGRRERALTPEKPKTYTRLGNSVERCRCALGFFAPALPVGPVQALIADLACLEAHLEKLEDDRWSQKRLTRFLDDWASQQAKRKAPQLHGVHNVLDYARARRDAQEASLQKLKPALASVRPARLRQGVRAALQAARTEPRSS